MRTIEPTYKPSFEQWVREFRVSTAYVDPSLQDMLKFDDVINYARHVKKKKITDYGKSQQNN